MTPASIHKDLISVNAEKDFYLLTTIIHAKVNDSLVLSSLFVTPSPLFFIDYIAASFLDFN